MGGKVWNDTVSIPDAKTLKYVLNTISEITKIENLESRLLGSGQLGKFPMGDIDINMDKDLYDQEHIMNILVTRLGRSSVNWLGNTLYCRVALGTNVYQVDFMFGDYNWQQFAYAGAINSKFKGVHRNMLIKAYAALLSDQTVFEDDELVARAGWTFMVQTGLMYRYRHRHFKRDGVTRVKAFTELNVSGWNEAYRIGMVPFSKPSSTITSVTKAMQSLFADDRVLPILDSYETLHTYLVNRLSSTKYDELMKIYHVMCEENRVEYT